MDRATAMGLLPDRYRQVIEQADEQRPRSEICRDLDLDETALSALLAIGNRKLRRLIDDGPVNEGNS